MDCAGGLFVRAVDGASENGLAADYDADYVNRGGRSVTGRWAVSE